MKHKLIDYKLIDKLLKEGIIFRNGCLKELLMDNNDQVLTKSDQLLLGNLLYLTLSGKQLKVITEVRNDIVKYNQAKSEKNKNINNLRVIEENQEILKTNSLSLNKANHSFKDIVYNSKEMAKDDNFEKIIRTGEYHKYLLPEKPLFYLIEEANIIGEQSPIIFTPDSEKQKEINKSNNEDVYSFEKDYYNDSLEMVFQPEFIPETFRKELFDTLIDDYLHKESSYLNEMNNNIVNNFEKIKVLRKKLTFYKKENK